MIRYELARFHPWSVLHCAGSVFPFSAAVALGSATMALLMKFLVMHEYITPSILNVLNESAAYSGFTTLVGFFIVFRTQQAYQRFQMGAIATHEMRGEWFDAASSLIAFCKHSEANISLVLRFQHKLIRLFSLLHSVALADLEDDGYHYHETWRRHRAFELPLLDVGGLDMESLKTLRDSDTKVELVFQWIQQLVVENIKTRVLSIPPPVLTRAFQELATGMVKYHDALVIAHVPFPFPYMQTAEVLLVLHWIFTPVILAAWTMDSHWAFLLCFISVLFLWSLNAIACELENPFGEDANDLDAEHAQHLMNARLLMLIRPSTLRVPKLNKQAMLVEEKCEFACRTTLSQVWDDLAASKDRSSNHLNSKLSVVGAAANLWGDSFSERMQQEAVALAGGASDHDRLSSLILAGVTDDSCDNSLGGGILGGGRDSSGGGAVVRAATDNSGRASSNGPAGRSSDVVGTADIEEAVAHAMEAVSSAVSNGYYSSVGEALANEPSFSSMAARTSLASTGGSRTPAAALVAQEFGRQLSTDVQLRLSLASIAETLEQRRTDRNRVAAGEELEIYDASVPVAGGLRAADNAAGGGPPAGSSAWAMRDRSSDAQLTERLRAQHQVSYRSIRSSCSAQSTAPDEEDVAAEEGASHRLPREEVPSSVAQVRIGASQDVQALDLKGAGRHPKGGFPR